MAEARSIEFLSVAFTAGVAAGTLVSGPSWLPISALLLPLGALPFFFPKYLLHMRGEWLTPLMLLSMLILGAWCATLSSIPSMNPSELLIPYALELGGRLRDWIGSLPFPSELTAPLLQALLAGDKSGLPRETIALFRQSGASHILALSGLHMGIIYLIFDRISRLAGQSQPVRVIRYVILLAAAGTFTLITGASPSLVRAFLFIFLNETAKLLVRPRKAARTLCVALLLQLILDPGVIRSVGFQLSYLAMAGIFLLYPVLESWWPDPGYPSPMRWIWKSAALSISCQLFTGPLAWYRFGSFPRHFLLTNLLALPLTTALMISAVATLLLSAIGHCPELLYTATDGLSRLLLWVLGIIAGM